METNSSISVSDNTSSRKIIIVVLCSLLVINALFFLIRNPLVEWILSNYQSQLLAATKGKISNIAVFLRHIAAEPIILTDLAFLLTGIHLAMRRKIYKKIPTTWRWLPDSAGMIVAINIFFFAAAGTLTFWMALGICGDSPNYLTTYEIKLHLAQLEQPPVSAVIVGSGQTQDQIDEGLLDKQLFGRLRTVDLTYNSAQPFDYLLMQQKFSQLHPRYVICYLSAHEFFQKVSGTRFQPFMSLSGIKDFYALGGDEFHIGKQVFYGGLGSVCPLFRLRDVLTQLVIGEYANNFKEHIWLRNQKTEHDKRLKQFVNSYAGKDKESNFQKKAFEEFIRRCEKNHTRVVICLGQMNPVVERLLDPKFEKDIDNFFHQLASRHDNVSYYDSTVLPYLAAEDYEDLTHVNEAAQSRFTTALAGLLLPELTSSVDAKDDASGKPFQEMDK